MLAAGAHPVRPARAIVRRDHDRIADVAWVPLAAWLRARGAKVVFVPPEQSADLRDYFNKHTKTDHLDSRVLARLPMLHPEGVRAVDDLGPGESLRRATRQRASLVKRRTTAGLRLDALVELLGPRWADTLGSGDYTKTSLVLLEKYADPQQPGSGDE